MHWFEGIFEEASLFASPLIDSMQLACYFPAHFYPGVLGANAGCIPKSSKEAASRRDGITK
jgi:hypothetical protein